MKPHQRKGWLYLLVGIFAGFMMIGLAKPGFQPAERKPSAWLDVLPVQAAVPPWLQAFMPFAPKAFDANTSLGEYIVIGWNDLGMHCYDLNYSQMAVLPPYNNLWAQVIRRGDPPQIVTSGLEVRYSFAGNTESATKTDFWQYAKKLFGVDLPLNIGLTGKGMADVMDPVTNAASDHFVAEGIPITEFLDNGSVNYYQLAQIVVKDQNTGNVLTTTQAVVPVSSEMRCDTCHTSSDGNFRKAILQKHDNEEGTNFIEQVAQGNPVLCASCHADPVLGAPGVPGVPSFSAAMHGKHAGKKQPGGAAISCYSCHPGPTTLCLRDVMSQQYDMTCEDCHGGMQQVASKTRTPWFDEPRCETCHAGYAENPGTLYRQSVGHGGLYCEACHNSTHAILPSREPADNLQSIMLQGYAGSIGKCTVCHLSEPSGSVHQ